MAITAVAKQLLTHPGERMLPDRPEFWLKLRLVLALGLVYLSSACSSSGRLDADPKAEITQLSSKYEVISELGQTPVGIIPEYAVQRYVFESPDTTPEYLIMIFPDEVDGDVKVPLEKASRKKAVISTYSGYIDLLLRSHRMVLKGQFTEAKRLITKLNDEYDLSYGALVLSGNIAALEGRDREAAEHYRMAKMLLTESQELDVILPKK